MSRHPSRHYVLAVLTAVYMLNLVDRGLMGLMLQPIKEDLHLSDTQLGLLTGIVFGLFYATLGLPIARRADRGDRAGITALAIGLWGVTVMATFFVSNYAQMIVARMAAAVGEAGCKPPTYSLVGDYFPEPKDRTRAMAVFWMGSPLGVILSFMLGGWLNEHFGWRFVFLIMGMPGVFLAILVRLTIVDPRSRKSPAQGSPEPPAPGLRLVLTTMWRGRSCRYLSAAIILVYTLSYGLSPWVSAYLIRNYGVGTTELGFWLGLILSLGGMAGLLAGGYAANHWFAGNERGQLEMSAWAVAIVTPSLVAFLIVPELYQALIAYIPLAISFIFFMGPVFSLLQRLVPDEMRATVLSIIMLLANLIGMGIGPQCVGIMSDLLTPVAGNDSLRYAMLVLSLTGLLAAYQFYLAGKTVTDDLIAARHI